MKEKKGSKGKEGCEGNTGAMGKAEKRAIAVNDQLLNRSILD